MANLHILKKELWQEGLLLSLMNVLKGEHTALHKKHTLQKLPRVLQQQLSNLSASIHRIVQYFCRQVSMHRYYAKHEFSMKIKLAKSSLKIPLSMKYFMS